MKNLRLITPGKIILLAVLLVLPLFFSMIGFSYGVLVCCFAFLYIVAVSGLDVDFGYCGQISMGHAAFFAIGAYGSVMLHQYAHIPVLATIGDDSRSGHCVSGFKARIPLLIAGNDRIW